SLFSNSRGPRVALSSKDQDDLWAALSDEDAVKAYRACRRLATDPEQTVSYFRQRLQPVNPPGVLRVEQLIAGLDDARFTVREKASLDLAELGELAESALQKALAEKPSLEVTRRIEELLKRMEPVSMPEAVRGLRAIEVL